MSKALEDGSFKISAPDGSKFKEGDNGKVLLVSDSGEKTPLSTTITDGGRAYSGDWSINGGSSATFTVTSTQKAASSTDEGVTAKKGKYAHCVVKNTAAASVVAAVVGAATAPGEVAVVPITMVASLAVYGINCATPD